VNGRPGRGTVDVEQVGLAGAVGEDRTEGEEHAVVRRGTAPGDDVLEGRRVDRHVVDDEVGHHRQLASERVHVVPGPELGVDRRVVDRVEPRVRTVDRVEERQHVHRVEDVGEGAGQQGTQARGGRRRAGRRR
jgi:hypothetical protein